MNDPYQTRQFFEQKVLNPHIIHLHRVDKLDNEQLQMINKMVEIAYNMPIDKLKTKK